MNPVSGKVDQPGRPAADLVYLLVRGRVVFAGEPGELEGSDIGAHYLGAEVGEVA